MGASFAQWPMGIISGSTLCSVFVAVGSGCASALALCLYYSTRNISLTSKGTLLVLLSFSTISAVPLFLFLHLSVVSPLALLVLSAYVFANVDEIDGPGEPLVPLVVFWFVPVVAMSMLAAIELLVRALA